MLLHQLSCLFHHWMRFWYSFIFPCLQQQQQRCCWIFADFPCQSCQEQKSVLQREHCLPLGSRKSWRGWSMCREGTGELGKDVEDKPSEKRCLGSFSWKNCRLIRDLHADLQKSLHDNAEHKGCFPAKHALAAAKCCRHCSRWQTLTSFGLCIVLCQFSVTEAGFVLSFLSKQICYGTNFPALSSTGWDSDTVRVFQVHSSKSKGVAAYLLLFCVRDVKN